METKANMEMNMNTNMNMNMNIETKELTSLQSRQLKKSCCHNKYEYHFDPVIAHNIGIVDGSDLASGHVGTQNNRGFQMSTLSPLYQQWIDGGKIFNYKYPIMDIGCAFGVNTLTASFRDGIPYVIGVDMTQSHLDYVNESYKIYSTQNYEYINGKVETIYGILPKLDNIKSESISSILCAEVIHFLNGDELQIGFKRFYEILIPGGQLQITCVSTDINGTGSALKDEINKRKFSNPNNKWPGYFESEDFRQLFKPVLANWKDLGDDIAKISDASMLHFFTASQVTKLAEDAGFIVKSIQTTKHPGHPPVVRSDYSSIQLVAIKL